MKIDSFVIQQSDQVRARDISKKLLYVCASPNPSMQQSIGNTMFRQKQSTTHGEKLHFRMVILVTFIYYRNGVLQTLRMIGIEPYIQTWLRSNPHLL